MASGGRNRPSPNLFEDLTDRQKEAVEYLGGPLLIVAGPGSGKTRVLSHRARHLLELKSKSRALLLTFTNKAAAEMKSRACASP